ncbi:MAG: putative hydrolase [Clostridia bacterium]|nr:putative hydrolase [Clostridia bacterium]
MLKHLYIVLAGFHTGTGFDGGSVKEYTRAAIAAMANPHVHIITHPGNPQFPINLEKLVLAAVKYNKAIEINNNFFSISAKEAYHVVSC